MPKFRAASRREDSGSNRTIWLLRNGVPASVPITIGATDGKRTEVVKGDLAADQAVIVDAVAAKR
jgi:HlyD family secretion protein